MTQLEWAKICLPRIRCGPIYVSLIVFSLFSVTESEPLDTWDDEETLLTPDADVEDDEVSKSAPGSEI